jgi:beta-phosphoglucomutase-like phosphatase (HAD superfamily)
VKQWIFDLDNTLVDSFPSYRRIITEVAGHFGVLLSVEDHEHIRHLVLPKF